MNDLSSQKLLKEKIEELIQVGGFREANTLLLKYSHLFPNDDWLLTTKAVIYLLNNELDKAEKLLLKGLIQHPFNADILYNIAYLYEQKKEYQLAYDFYLDSEFFLEDSEKTGANSVIQNLKNISPNIVIKPKIAVFVKLGLDSFIDDIITALQDRYNVRKIFVTTYDQIDQGMKWADICWFEWCDELIVYASKHELAKDKKMICRIHRYEVFTHVPNQVIWENVDKLIIVTDHLQTLLKKNVVDIDKRVSIVTINNGVDLQKYKFSERLSGFNIAYIGFIHSRKNPYLLLQLINSLVKRDKKYKLFIAGKFQDELVELYWNHLVKELNLEENIIFEGWQEDIDTWLNDKNYIVSTSIHESFGYGIAEAMARGVKPVIHNFIHSNEIWPSNYLFSSLEDAIKLITEKKYNSIEYRSYIEENYSLKKQIKNTLLLINEVNNSKKEIKNTFDYEQYWNNRLNSNFNIEGVGYIGLGEVYNEFLYKARFDVLKVITNKFSKQCDQSILEIGPGVGLFTEYFSRQMPRNYYGLDISSKSVSTLSFKYPNFKFKKGDISDRKVYPSGQKFSLIFGADVLLHLTDERKYEETISNFSQILNEDGIIVLLDPISVIGSKSKSNHVIIRDINYVKEVLNRYELEIKSVIPTNFFMNYPFDANLLNPLLAKKSLQIFNLINQIFSQTSEKTHQEIISNILFLLDKLLLFKYGFGLSQKVLIISKKKMNFNLKLDIHDVWSYKELSSQYKKLKKQQNLLDLLSKNNDLKTLFNLISNL